MKLLRNIIVNLSGLHIAMISGWEQPKQDTKSYSVPADNRFSDIIHNRVFKNLDVIGGS